MFAFYHWQACENLLNQATNKYQQSERKNRQIISERKHCLGYMCSVNNLLGSFEDVAEEPRPSKTTMLAGWSNQWQESHRFFWNLILGCGSLWVWLRSCLGLIAPLYGILLANVIKGRRLALWRGIPPLPEVPELEPRDSLDAHIARMKRCWPRSLQQG